VGNIPAVWWLAAILVVVAVVTIAYARALRRAERARLAAATGNHKADFRVRFGSGAARLVGLAAGVLGVLLFLSAFLKVVPANNVAIPTTFGEIGSPLQSGIHVVNPFTQLHDWTLRLQESSMLQDPTEGDRAKDDSTDVRASDNGVLNVDSTIVYKVDPSAADRLYRDFSDLPTVRDRIVRPTARSAIRDVFARHTAQQGLAQDRLVIEQEITKSVADQMQSFGITVTTVKIRGVRPSAPVAAAIDAKIKAQQEAEQAQITQGQKVTEAETARLVAEKTAEATRLAAQGEADATRTRAQAEADANGKVAQSITPELIDYVRAQALKDANTIYVPSNGTVVVAPGATGTTVAAAAAGSGK
jgi:regulator of protease activity HflC (stomatin/prohibitin superfamily)